MSDRLKNYINREEEARLAELDIIYDQAVTVDVFRNGGEADNPGFSEEVDDKTLIRSINVRLDPTPSKQTQHAFLALTDDKDVQVNDTWRWTPPRGGEAIMLEVKVSLYRPAGTHVELDYA